MTDNRNETQEDARDDRVAAAVQAPEDRAELSALQRERDELKDRLLRTAAEFDNYRKRTDRDRVALSESISASVLEDLLPLLDDLERAIAPEATTEGAEAYRRGVELVVKQLVELLRKRGVTPIEAAGADFDPNFHQAVLYEPVAGHREGEITEEFRRGFMIGDRMLRPAMVKVAKG